MEFYGAQFLHPFQVGELPYEFILKFHLVPNECTHRYYQLPLWEPF